MCTPALAYGCVPKIFAGPKMEKNLVGIYVYVCVVPKSQAACIRKQIYIYYVLMVNRSKIYI